MAEYKSPEPTIMDGMNQFEFKAEPPVHLTATSMDDTEQKDFASKSCDLEIQYKYLSLRTRIIRQTERRSCQTLMKLTETNIRSDN